MHGATIRDVAREAAVSVATVSRVLNGTAPVADDTRRRVLDAAERLRDQPQAAARSLGPRRTGALAVILPDLQASSSPSRCEASTRPRRAPCAAASTGCS